MFKITDRKGFHITFENGYTVSVQFGPSSYCENYSMLELRDFQNCISRDAEVAVIDKKGKCVIIFDHHTIKARQSPKEVLKIMNWAAMLPKQKYRKKVKHEEKI